jgi:hypothetical protein
LRSGALILAACWNKSPAPAPMPTSLDASAHDPTGFYWCSIDDEKNLEFRCEITRRGGVLRIEKQSGAERIRGELTLSGDVLEFKGERFCMWEDCTAKLVGTFVPTGNGTYRGTFKDAPLVVRLAPMPEGSEGATGGQTYGVDTDRAGAP